MRWLLGLFGAVSDRDLVVVLNRVHELEETVVEMDAVLRVLKTRNEQLYKRREARRVKRECGVAENDFPKEVVVVNDGNLPFTESVN